MDNLYCEAFEDHVLTQWDKTKGVPQGVARAKDTEWVDFIDTRIGDKVPRSCYRDYVQSGGGSKIFHQECATLTPVRILKSDHGTTRYFPLHRTTREVNGAFMLDTENTY